MAARVRDFLQVHKTEVAGEEATALARLETLLQRADVLSSQQRAGVVTARSATVQREGLRRQLVSKLLRYLGGIGVAAAKEHTELAAQFRLPPTNSSNQALLTMAKGMLAQATAQKDVLVSRGMSPTVLDDLTAAIGEFEKTLEATRAGRRDHVGASADLKSVTAEVVEQVHLLDGMVRYRFGENAELMGAWNSARNVLGPFRSKTETPTPPEPTPSTDGKDAVKPAA